jgi:hypothetical protein
MRRIRTLKKDGKKIYEKDKNNEREEMKTKANRGEEVWE